MLHILWLILKFILIVLGIALGLVLLAVLLVLFCPVRYQASAVKDGDNWNQAQVSGGVSWLFRLISVRVIYTEGQLKKEIRIFGISLDKLLGLTKKKASPKQASQNRRNNSEEKTVVQKEEPLKIPDIKPDPVPVKHITSKKSDESFAKEHSNEKSDTTSASKPSDKDPNSGLFQKIRVKIKKIIDIPLNILRKIIAFPGMLLHKLQIIKLTIQNIYGKIDWWKEFLSHPRTKEAISFVWNEAKGLIRHILPTKIQGNVTFGSEDPSITGTVLGILGMTFPFHKNRIEVTPLFNGENCLTGHVELKGRMYGIVFLKAAIEIYLHKNIKYVINRWKHKED